MPNVVAGLLWGSSSICTILGRWIRGLESAWKGLQLRTMRGWLEAGSSPFPLTASPLRTCASPLNCQVHSQTSTICSKRYCQSSPDTVSPKAYIEVTAMTSCACFGRSARVHPLIQQQITMPESPIIYDVALFTIRKQ